MSKSSIFKISQKATNLQKDPVTGRIKLVRTSNEYRDQSLVVINEMIQELSERRNPLRVNSLRLSDKSGYRVKDGR